MDFLRARSYKSCMARPRKNTSPDHFTSTEMALAAGISARNFGVLVEAGLAPEATNTDSGKNTSRLWDRFGIGKSAVIGAVHKGGAELMMSAKIGELVVEEFASGRGYLPTRFSEHLDPPLNPNHNDFPWEATNQEIMLSTDNDFWLHHFLRTKASNYKPWTAMDGDLIVEIVDRRYVFTDFAYRPRHEREAPQQKPWAYVASDTPEIALEIEGWEKGKEAIIRPPHEILGCVTDPAEKTRIEETQQAWLLARQNAVGLLRVNASLAIRNAFDTIHDHRVANGTMNDWVIPDHTT